jgi:hypothetical protein
MEQASQPSAGVKRKSVVSLRAVALGALLIPLNCYWIIILEVRWYSLDGTCLPLFVTPVFFLLCLVLMNLALRAIAPRTRLSQGELLTIYSMLLMSGAMAGHDTLQNMFGAITHPAWYVHENPALPWPRTFFNFLPRHLLVWDTNALQGFYEGGSSMYRLAVLRAWAVPLIWWGAFVLVLSGMMICLNILLRRPWTEQERLAFPIVQLPIAMTLEDGGFFRSRLMWAGFIAAFSIGTLNGLHYFFPSLPYLKVRHGEIFVQPKTRPWNAIGSLPFSFYPFAIGIAYFLPLDLAFSCWFFYLTRHMQIVASEALGLRRLQDFPYINEQASGAWIGLAVVALWGVRGFLGSAVRTAIRSAHPGQEPAEDPEAATYRWATAGLLAGACFTLWFGLSSGMSLWVAVVFFSVYFALSIAITRVRAEFGSPHEIFFVNPGSIMASVFGPEVLQPRNLTSISVFYWLNRGYRNHPMPNQLEAFKMAEAGKMEIAKLAGALAIALFIGVLATYWAHLDEGYRKGAMAEDRGFKWWAGAESFNRLESWLEYGVTGKGPRRIATALGFAIVAILRVLRGRYIWWPLHPAGYALGVSFAMDYFWSAFLISWAVKLVLVRYGGMKTHRAAIPFFLGLILGDYTIGSIWGIIGPLKNIKIYKMFISG